MDIIVRSVRDYFQCISNKYCLLYHFIIIRVMVCSELFGVFFFCICSIRCVRLVKLVPSQMFFVGRSSWGCVFERFDCHGISLNDHPKNFHDFDMSRCYVCKDDAFVKSFSETISFYTFEVHLPGVFRFRHTDVFLADRIHFGGTGGNGGHRQ